MLCADTEDNINRQSSSGIDENWDRLIRARAYITNHFDQKLTLKEIARISFLSPNYFHKLFKSAFGRTPGEFLLERRIFNAKRMLSETSKSISQIAEACGFDSQPYFQTQFKTVVGQTPLQYRKCVLSQRRF
jgi:AraC-like DNA-binding protein